MKCFRKISAVCLVFVLVNGCKGREIKKGVLPVLTEFYRNFQERNIEEASKYLCPEIRSSFLMNSKDMVRKLGPGRIRVNTHSLGSDIGQHYAIVYLEGPGFRKGAEIRIEKIDSFWMICPEFLDDLIPKDLRSRSS